MAYVKPQPRSNKVQVSFRRLFSEDSIIRELCRERAKLADRRNDRLFLHRITQNAPSEPKATATDLELEGLFPPRKKWHGFRPRIRRSASAQQLKVETLFRTVINLRHLPESKPWSEKLSERVHSIQYRALKSTPFRFAPLTIRAVEKERASHKYRPVATFALEDKIIDSLTARYFRLLLDQALRPSCMAFRCARPGVPPPSIHDALKRVLNVNRRHRKNGVFVAECDIKGFFDCVSHKVARDALLELTADARKATPGLSLHSRAVEIFDAYLNAYSFLGSILRRRERLLSRDPWGEFKWPREDLAKFHGTAEPERVGVPQGAALSCLVANAVLHAADKKLDRLRRRKGNAFSYMRYCDDMILLAAKESVCEQAFETYKQALTEKLLPIHPPAFIETYNRAYWEGKSKAPFRWGNHKGDGDVPWIQFVGYQVRYDGLVRVRPSSVRKQREKITKLVNQLFKMLNPGRKRRGVVPEFAAGITKSNHQIVHRIRQKFISVAVGRVKPGQTEKEPRPMCWASGFRGLVGQKLVTFSLKALDRHRERQIQRVVRRLRLRTSQKRSKSEAKNTLRFYGKPFSYWGQFN